MGGPSVIIERACIVLLAAAALASAGCDGKNHVPPAEADPATARAALEKALDCWRMRITPGELQAADPPITVKDVDWREGRRLLEFQLLAGEVAWGSSIRWPVRLKLVQADGREETLEVLYIVSTSPIIHISRRD
jgi:hypothetical protein